MRLDQYLFEHGMAPSRERAKAFIMAGIVYVDGERADKAGTKVPQDTTVEVRGTDMPYVSRGGLKLEKAFKVFPLDVTGKICMDIGASTGGFTDCMLKNGAAKVYAVDVGYGQLAWTLRNDERVVVMERCNARHLQPEQISDPIEFFSIDVSFISVEKIFPALASLCSKQAEGICLVKPQFEAGRDKVGKKGVVRDSTIHAETIQMVSNYAVNNGFTAYSVDFSPVKGPEGNIEFLLYLKREEPPVNRVSDDAEVIAVKAKQELQGVE